MPKPRVRIEDWRIVGPIGQQSLIGVVYGHPFGADGDCVRTSLIIDIRMADREIETMNTVYVLGRERP